MNVFIATKKSRELLFEWGSALDQSWKYIPQTLYYFDVVFFFACPYATLLCGFPTLSLSSEAD